VDKRELVVDAWRMINATAKLPPSIWVISCEHHADAVGVGVCGSNYRRRPSDEVRLTRPTIRART